MTSDWRVIDAPLTRAACDRCGLAARPLPSPSDAAALFHTDYTLYAHPPGEPRERARQEAYAAWIAAAVPAAPARVLDVGCGNGSLLIALRAHYPQAEMLGCDPSAASVAWGDEHGLRLWQGAAESLSPDLQADLVVAVNVIEHTTDPLAFIGAVSGALAKGGTLVLVCPDGARPGVELLIADHLFSFAPGHVETLLARAGMCPVAAGAAPGALGAFRLVAARRAPNVAVPDPPAQVADSIRRSYLTRWKDLDAHLVDRVKRPAVCFGASEAAGLLRAYAPNTWTRISACTADGAPRGVFGSLPLVPLDEVRGDHTVLLGVRPADQPRVAERLRARFAGVATWYDLVDDA